MTDLIEVSQSMCICNLTSPAFEMHPPEIRGREIVPDNVLRAMSASWEVARFAERPVRMFLLEDVYIAEEGLVFNSKCQLYRESITQHGPVEIERACSAVQSTIAAKIPGYEGTFILCKKRGVKNYGHWLMEMLPKAYLGRLYTAFRNLRYIVPAAVGQLDQVIKDSLSMLEIPEIDMLQVGSEVSHVDQLLIVDGLTAHGVFMSPLVLNCLDAVAARVRGNEARRIFITRSGEASRRLVHETEIYQRAEACGYCLIDPKVLSFREQIATFKNAVEVVSVMGAEQTNIVFAPRGASVVSLAPATMPDTFFWFIAGLKGQVYREQRCRQVGAITGVARWDTDLALEQGDLDAIFTKWEAR